MDGQSEEDRKATPRSRDVAGGTEPAHAGASPGCPVTKPAEPETRKLAEREMRMIVDHIPAIFVSKDAKGNILRANKLAAALYGRPVEDIEGRHLTEVLPEEYSSLILAEDRKVIETGEAIHDRLYEVPGRDGTRLWYRSSRIPVLDPVTGEPVVYSLSQDVTAHKHVEIEREISESRFAMAVAGARVGIFDWNIETGVEYWSDRYKEMLGVTNADFSGQYADFTQRIHPDDRERVLRAMNAHLEDDAPYVEEYRMRRDDGRYVWIEGRGQALRDRNGKAIRFNGIATDLTRRNETLVALREREQQMVLAERLSGVGYWKIDLIEQSAYWSEGLYAILDETPETLQPNPEIAEEIYHPDDRRRIRRRIRDAIESADSFDYEGRIMRRNGTVRQVRGNGAVHRNPDAEGGVAAVFGVVVDVTDAKKREAEMERTLEELSRSNAELNRFSYVCSHDLKEPVRMIEGMTRLLLTPGLLDDEDQRQETLHRINKNAVRLRSMIDGLLAYSRIDARVGYSDVDLNLVLADIVDSLTFALERSDAALRVAHLPPVHGAKIHFMQLFQNLIGNALKFSDKQKPIVEISASLADGRVLFCVEDNGPGIPEASRVPVFDIFERLEGPDGIEGSGLGLSICKRIVSQYGGTIWCDESRLGGAAFRFTISNRDASDED